MVVAETRLAGRFRAAEAAVAAEAEKAAVVVEKAVAVVAETVVIIARHTAAALDPVTARHTTMDTGRAFGPPIPALAAVQISVSH